MQIRNSWKGQPFTFSSVNETAVNTGHLLVQWTITAEVGRVSELWVEEDGVEEESALLMGKKEGRIIDFIALPRAGPQGKDLSACYISLGYYL